MEALTCRDVSAPEISPGVSHLATSAPTGKHGLRRTCVWMTTIVAVRTSRAQRTREPRVAATQPAGIERSAAPGRGEAPDTGATGTHLPCLGLAQDPWILDGDSAALCRGWRQAAMLRSWP